MGKGKLEKFEEMKTFSNVFQYPYSVLSNEPFEMKGQWRQMYFKNNNPIIIELGCGRGEYTVELGKQYPDKNFIGVDIKGARMWAGAKEALEKNLPNVAFLRTNIEIIDRFFGTDEVQEIWLTFSDPQMKSVRKRLTSTYFLKRYQHFLKDNGVVHLKTDSNFLFTYTTELIHKNKLQELFNTTDLYHTADLDEEMNAMLHIRTYYEQMWIERGLNIKYLKFRLPQNAVLEEPEIDIPLDEYRSYRREKRSGLQTAK